MLTTCYLLSPLNMEIWKSLSNVMKYLTYEVMSQCKIKFLKLKIRKVKFSKILNVSCWSYDKTDEAEWFKSHLNMMPVYQVTLGILLECASLIYCCVF